MLDGDRRASELAECWRWVDGVWCVSSEDVFTCLIGIVLDVLDCI